MVEAAEFVPDADSDDELTFALVSLSVYHWLFLRFNEKLCCCELLLFKREIFLIAAQSFLNHQMCQQTHIQSGCEDRGERGFLHFFIIIIIIFAPSAISLL